MKTDLISFEEEAIQETAQQIHTKPLHTFIVLLIGEEGQSTWPEIEIFLNFLRYDDKKIVKAIDNLESIDVLKVYDHGRIASQFSVIILTSYGRKILYELQQLEKSRGYPITKELLLQAIQRRLSLKNPEFDNVNTIPVLIPMLETWIGSGIGRLTEG